MGYLDAKDPESPSGCCGHQSLSPGTMRSYPPCPRHLLAGPPGPLLWNGLVPTMDSARGRALLVQVPPHILFSILHTVCQKSLSEFPPLQLRCGEWISSVIILRASFLGFQPPRSRAAWKSPSGACLLMGRNLLPGLPFLVTECLWGLRC